MLLPGRTRRAVAHDELGVDERRAARLAALHLVQERFDRTASDLAEELANGGERRPEAARLLHVVEADDADLAWNGAVGFVKGAQDAQRHLVVRREDGGHLGVAREL